MRLGKGRRTKVACQTHLWFLLLESANIMNLIGAGNGKELPWLQGCGCASSVDICLDVVTHSMTIVEAQFLRANLLHLLHSSSCLTNRLSTSSTALRGTILSPRLHGLNRPWTVMELYCQELPYTLPLKIRTQFCVQV